MSFNDFMSVLAGIDRYGMHPVDRVVDRDHCRLILRRSHRQNSGKSTIRSQHVAAAAAVAAVLAKGYARRPPSR
jgi:hypothetical protein